MVYLKNFTLLDEFKEHNIISTKKEEKRKLI